MALSSGSGGASAAPPTDATPSSRAVLAGRGGAGEDVHGRSLRDRDLGDEMRRGSEAVDAEAPA